MRCWLHISDIRVYVMYLSVTNHCRSQITERIEDWHWWYCYFFTTCMEIFNFLTFVIFSMHWAIDMHPHKVSFILLFPREGIDLSLYFHIKCLKFCIARDLLRRRLSVYCLHVSVEATLGCLPYLSVFVRCIYCSVCLSVCMRVSCIYYSVCVCICEMYLL